MSKGYAAVGLHQPKTATNVGAALRAVGVYEAAMLAICGKRFKMAATDTNQEFKNTPVFNTLNLKDIIPYNCIPVAVEIVEGAIPLPSYNHPERAFYIFGPEDGAVPNEVLGWCRDIVSIPTKYCMNLAATVNVVLYDRMAKGLRNEED
jgi:tRNA(Leu) C34 or U34 (ribose-2'-O)-methylase TrmL